jgi:signal transduction histidine kinase/DNA-binding response OmpR family regulator
MKNDTADSAKRILVIEDDGGIRQLLSLTLEYEGYQVLSAGTGAHAQQLIARQTAPIHLILLDLMLPDMTGAEIYGRLRRSPFTQTAAVIILSAVKDAATRVQFLEMGVDDYIAKPFITDDLLARIATQLKLAELRQARQQAEALLAQQNLQLSSANQKLLKIASENARLLVVEQMQRLQAQKLREIAADVNASLEPDEIVAVSLKHIVEIVEVGQAVIFLPDKLGTRLVTAGVSHPFANHAIPETVSRSEGFVAQLLQTGKPYYSNSPAEDPHYSPTMAQFMPNQVRSVLGVPILSHKQDWGAIQLFNKRQGPFNDEDAAVLLSVGSIMSIALDNACLYSRQAELLRQLHASQAQLVQSEKLVTAGRLAASLAHEINNPLQAIHSCLQLALNFTLSPAQQTEYLSMANEEVERVIDIVTRVFEFARPSAGKPESANVNSVVNQVMNLAHKYIAHANLSVQQKLATDLPPVQIVPNQIAQVCLNIILNAIDAAGEAGELLITTKADAQWVKIAFQDNGCGMSPEELSQIFEPFYSGRDQAGLGLTVGYAIMEQHGGYIKAESQPGQGSLFTLYLPRH